MKNEYVPTTWFCKTNWLEGETSQKFSATQTQMKLEYLFHLPTFELSVNFVKWQNSDVRHSLKTGLAICLAGLAHTIWWLKTETFFRSVSTYEILFLKSIFLNLLKWSPCTALQPHSGQFSSRRSKYHDKITNKTIQKLVKTMVCFISRKTMGLSKINFGFMSTIVYHGGLRPKLIFLKKYKCEYEMFIFCKY